MALDWSKEISFSGLRKSKAENTSYPSKRHIDLMTGDKREFNLRKALPKIILGVIVLVLFVKFGVFDMFERVGEAEKQLATHQSALSAAKENLKDYDSILAEYEGYEFASADEDGLVVDATEVLDLIDKNVVPEARVASFSMNGDTLTLNLTGISLDEVGKLADKLSEQDIVSDVSVQTASTKQNSGLISTLTVTLTPVSDEKEVE